MIEKNTTFIFGFVAVGIYIALLGIFIFYFNVHDKNHAKHYVIKNQPTKIDQAIEVSLEKLSIEPIKKRIKRIIPQKVKKRKKNKQKKRIINKSHKKHIIKKKKKTIQEHVKKRIKKVRKKVIPSPKKHKIIKKRIKKVKIKSKENNITKLKKTVNTQSLFSKITVHKVKKISHTTLFNSIQITKNKPKASGIENKYLAHIEKKLKGWPTQSEYVGEKAKVWLKIEKNGYFKFKIMSASSNNNFNEGLKSYLKQLQEFGFGRHKSKRAYEINVEFIATE